MSNFKELNRITIPLEAKSYQEFIEKQLDLQRLLDKPFDFQDCRVYFDDKGNVIKVVGFYRDTLKPGERRSFK